MNKSIRDFIINDILKYQSNNWNRNYYKIIDFISRIKDKPILIFQNELNNYYASYDKIKDVIMITSITGRINPIHFYRIYLHELIHSTGNINRLNRYTLNKRRYKVGVYAKEEIVAEYTTAMIMAYYGFEEVLFDTSLDYIELYYELLDNPNDLYECIDYSKEAYDYLMN